MYILQQLMVICTLHFIPVYSSLLVNLCYWTHTLNELHVLTDIYASCVFMTAWRGQRSVCEVDYPLHELYIGLKAQGAKQVCLYYSRSFNHSRVHCLTTGMQWLAS